MSENRNRQARTALAVWQAHKPTGYLLDDANIQRVWQMYMSAIAGSAYVLNPDWYCALMIKPDYPSRLKRLISVASDFVLQWVCGRSL